MKLFTKTISEQWQIDALFRQLNALEDKVNNFLNSTKSDSVVLRDLNRRVSSLESCPNPAPEDKWISVGCKLPQALKRVWVRAAALPYGFGVGQLTGSGYWRATDSDGKRYSDSCLAANVIAVTHWREIEDVL